MRKFSTLTCRIQLTHVDRSSQIVGTNSNLYKIPTIQRREDFIVKLTCDEIHDWNDFLGVPNQELVQFCRMLIGLEILAVKIENGCVLLLHLKRSKSERERGRKINILPFPQKTNRTSRYLHPQTQWGRSFVYPDR